MVNIPWFIEFYTSQVVSRISSINSISRLPLEKTQVWPKGPDEKNFPITLKPQSFKKHKKKTLKRSKTQRIHMDPWYIYLYI